MTINEFKDFIFENYYRGIGFFGENSYYSMKHQEKNLQLFAAKLTKKIPDPSNAKEYCSSYLKKKNLKIS